MTRTSAPKTLTTATSAAASASRTGDRDYYDRHLVFDHVVAAGERQPARALRGRGPLAPRPAHPALAADPADLTTGRTPSGSTTCRWSS